MMEFPHCTVPPGAVSERPPTGVQEDFTDLCCLLSTHLGTSCLHVAGYGQERGRAG